jgi:ABC-2 type transport system permease protein
MLTYRFEVFSDAIFSFIRILLAFVLWQAIFSSKVDISGYSFSSMITYYILVTLLISLEKSSEVSSILSSEIKSGNYTKYVTKPINSMGNYFAMIIPKVSYVLIFNFLATIIAVFIFKKHFILPENGVMLLLGLLIYLMGLVFMALLNYFFTILTFWVVDTTAFYMIKDHFIEFTAGALIPLALLPDKIISIFSYLPFYYVYYYPISLYLNKPTSSVTTAIVVLSIWCILLFMLNIYIYKRAIKSYDGVGI